MRTLRFLMSRIKEFAMRYPAVAGAFYPSQRLELEKQLEWCFAKEAGEPKLGDEKGLVAVVSPHAGYFYSGWVAAFSYSEIARSFKEPPVFVIAGPNHTGQGSVLAISLQDWQTPLGIAKNDVELAKRIQKHSRLIDFDETAHEYEHSIEVQLPFLQYLYGEKVRMVPICMMMQDLDAAKDVAEATFKAATELKREIVFVASSDFTHYESAKSAAAKDAMALAKLEGLDAEGFNKVRALKNATICGYGPITAAIIYARLRGCTKGKVLRYANSGDVTGDFNQVVAYCSAAFRIR